MSKAQDSKFIKYKFKSLLTYASTEWLGDSKKKYRRVFNKCEVSYIYVEFSFYNKLFDEENWSANIKLLCNKVIDGKEEKICEINKDYPIRMEDNITFIREGWGNPAQGAFWNKGEYIWHAYIDNKLIASQKFFIEDEKEVSPSNNPFFDIESIKFFEGDYQLPRNNERKYLISFDGNKTRYIWAEVTLNNKLEKNWYCEIVYNFYNDAGQLKGTTSELFLFNENKKVICSGWGSSAAGTWHNDAYRVEIVFMDHLVGTALFNVNNTFEEGIPELYKAGAGFIAGQPQEEKNNIDEATLEELLAKMDELVGMQNIKQKIRDYVKYLQFLKIRQEKGFEESGKISLHAVLTGNPGTGKTTIAKQLGKIYKAMGLLTKGHVHEVDRSDLIAEFIGQTAPKTKKCIEQARGGILFIDEAYSLHRNDHDNKDFGKEAIEIILKEMSDGAGNIAIVVAGYPQEMKSFLESNPGLKSRFNHYFNFEDYQPEEMMEIAFLGFKNRKLQLKQDAREYLFTKFTQAYRDRDRTFGNARFVMSVVDEAKMNMGLRLMQNENINQLSEEELSTITLPDIQKIFSMGTAKTLDIQVDDKLLKEALAELNNLTGLQNVKEEINELVKLVKYYKEIGKNVLNKFVLHSVFVGNPGTGKTTVARIFAKIFRALGIIEKGHLIECDREALVAGYSGQTAIKTADMVDKALGGVLFIDEAYALNQGNNDAFGMEAINTLLKRMEDNRDDFVVIAAGYTDNMNEFLTTNPGLKSRFERTFVFHDYNTDELMQIMLNMLASEALQPDDNAKKHLFNIIETAYNHRDKFFGNAREIRKLAAAAVKNQHLRMASLEASQRTPEMMMTLTLDDVKEFNAEMYSTKKQQVNPVGFKINKDNQ
jgi:SpoVK/Ycf46/Vps4 family AAA+-type ATPase